MEIVVTIKEDVKTRIVSDSVGIVSVLPEMMYTVTYLY